jgi:hypothetical protein
LEAKVTDNTIFLTKEICRQAPAGTFFVADKQAVEKDDCP